MGPKATSKNASARTGLPPLTRGHRQRFLKEKLRPVSRAFYLTLRMLPEDLREPIGLAYLLARAADTIADTRVLPPQERLLHLLEFRAQVKGPPDLPALESIAALATDQSSPAEKELLATMPRVFSMLEALPDADRELIRSVVGTLTQGMEMDLATFPAEASGETGALRSWEELDRYTYFVAGCVGEFWTRIAVAHTPALKRWDEARMSELGVRFGKALQLTNVLRDVPRDLRLGRCYLPEKDLEEAGIRPQDLLNPAVAPRARPVLVKGIRVALAHYEAAEQYLCAIPRRCLRLRLAVAWPILIGLGTLDKLARNEKWLDPAFPSKVSRSWVYRILLLSIPCAPSNLLLEAWIAVLRNRALRALQ